MWSVSDKAPLLFLESAAVSGAAKLKICFRDLPAFIRVRAFKCKHHQTPTESVFPSARPCFCGAYFDDRKTENVQGQGRVSLHCHLFEQLSTQAI